MSTRKSPVLLAGLVSAAVTLVMSAAALAQDKGVSIEETKQRQQVLVQKYEAEVKKAKEDARTLARMDKKQAIFNLTTLRDAIGTDADLPEPTRTALVRSLNISIDGLQGIPTETTAPPVSTPPIRREDPKKEDPEIRKAVDETAERLKKDRIAKAEADYLKQTRNENYLALQRANDKVLMPQAEDITFPKNWVELTAKRTQVRMTPEEKKLLEALSKPIDIDLPDTTLEAVIDFLHDKTGAAILVPPSVLEDKGITYKAPVSVKLKGVTMRTVLKKTLADVGLTFIVEKGIISVTTEEIAKTKLTTRTYYIGDLVSVTGQRYNPYGSNKLQTIRTMNDIIGVIVGTVEPNSWWVNGGPGTIAFDPVSMALVVKQTADIHYMLSGLGGR